MMEKIGQQAVGSKQKTEEKRYKAESSLTKTALKEKKDPN
jgi:hypothetical protein